MTWTGDQSASWDYIRWHVPTLIGSGLSGQAYATGDVDDVPRTPRALLEVECHRFLHPRRFCERP